MRFPCGMQTQVIVARLAASLVDWLADWLADCREQLEDEKKREKVLILNQCRCLSSV